jgi:hypothetical protein
MAVGYLASRGAAVVGEHHRGLRAHGELADESVVGVVVAEDPAGAVEVDDHRQRPAGALRAQDAHRHLAGRAAGHGGVLDVDGRLLDRAGLDRIDGPATLVRAELKQVGRIRVGVDDGLGLRLEVDGVGHDCLLLRPLGNSSAGGHRWPDRARTAPPTCAQRPASTAMGQLIVIGVRRPTLPGSACAHRGERVNQTRPAASSVGGRWGCAPSGGRPRDQGSPSPPASTPLGLPPLVCGLSGQLRCSASRSTAVVVALPGQLPGHGKPGVGLGELQLSAPQVLLDVDVGPALLGIDLVVERLGRWSAPRTLAAWRRPRSAPSTPTWLTTFARSTRTFSPSTTVAEVSMPSGCACCRGGWQCRSSGWPPPPSSAYDPAQVLRSGGGRLTRLVEQAPATYQAPPVRARGWQVAERRGGQCGC